MGQGVMNNMMMMMIRNRLLAVVLIALGTVQSGCSQIVSGDSRGVSKKGAATVSETPDSVRSGKSIKVAIDIGHSLKSLGAGSARGVGEFYFNQTIGKLLDKSLRSRGYQTVLINGDGKVTELRDRTKLAKQAGADLFISIHHDSCQNSFKKKWTVDGREQSYADQFSGFSVFFSTRNKQSKQSLELAIEIGSALDTAKFHPTLHHAAKIKGEGRDLVRPLLGVYDFPDLIVLHSASMPAVLVECGVIVNRQEELELQDPAVQSRIVAAVTKGVDMYVASRPKGVGGL